ncbi:hypothetical protein DICPUDRAFT_91023 [Dictyostelium purpureum]|uniref:Uncharacterized protein n=1 Tax=Dictyostelium purpureum TaxID=5786 RepID=F0Z6I6_DICPU|nr:uncharacterized protein DICPUDRAFT_91023 [Dictyostelium purpureum]EGC40496.1 hypothetical protein DICPUDRAFT_91023 [Dictyostelium purpureum]|eukprot:XP_003283043.1 hypothetical protein DICPUDRAFT_91023 [Dictyostelium purpureum]
MRTVISLLLAILALVSVSSAVKCGNYKNPLTCANMEPPCFWDGKVCKMIYPKSCEDIEQSDECQLHEEKGCNWNNEQCITLNSKFHCSSIKNEFDCTIENCAWKDNRCEN